jgi:hypothetical protein
MLANIIVYLLKARTVKPEKRPLLANGSEITFVSRQRLGKHVPAATHTIKVLLKRCFLLGLCEGVIRKKIGAFREDLSAEAKESLMLEAFTRERG